jgi:hypothetical protein
MKITLEKMQIHHFGGIEDKTIEFNDKENFIIQPNKTGKTTHADAFNWVICGKDSLGNTRFDFTPTNIENAKPNVILFLDKDGEKIKLEKSVGKWKYNDLEVSKTVFEDFLKNIYDVQTLELLSNPLAFMQLHWETRRNFLTSLFCNKVTEGNEFDFMMKSMSISDIRKSKTQQKKVANDGLKRSATIIEVYEKDLLKAKENDFEGLKSQLESKAAELQKLETFDWSNYYAKQTRFTSSKKDYAGLIAEYKKIDNLREIETTVKLEDSSGCSLCGSKISQSEFDKRQLQKLEKHNAALSELKTKILAKRDSNVKVKEEFEALEKTKPDDTLPLIISQLKKGIDNLKILISKENDIAELQKKIDAERVKLDNFTDEVMAIESFMDRFATFLVDNYFKSINDNFEGLFFDIENECRLTNERGTEYKRFSLSEKINTGIKIIDALSKKIDLHFPLWVDNRESVSELYPIDTQIINLKVKEIETA